MKPPKRLFVPLACGALVAAAGFAGPPAAQAKGSVSPLTVHLEGLSVGGAREFRLAVVHPLFGPKFSAESHGLIHAADASPDTLGISARLTRLQLASFIDQKLLLLPGEIVRDKRVDLAVRRHRVADGKTRVEVPVAAVTREPGRSTPTTEPRLMGRLLSPTLRWHVLEGVRAKDLLKTTKQWAEAAGLDDDRHSPADLPDGEAIAKRVKEYMQGLSSTASPPAGTELVGYAALVDGDVAVLESFGSHQLFKRWFPEAMRSLAVECAMAEVEKGILEEDLAETGDPDRYITRVKERLVSLYGRKPRVTPIKDLGYEYLVEAKNHATARALVIDGKTAHVVLLVDPAHRRVPDTGEGFEPGVIGRKPRPTEAEKRWKDRRDGRVPPPPPLPDE